MSKGASAYQPPPSEPPCPTGGTRWITGLIGAAINSAASAVTVVIVDPQDFDPTSGGIRKLLSVVAVAAVFGAALYLKQHPVPGDDA